MVVEATCLHEILRMTNDRHDGILIYDDGAAVQARGPPASIEISQIDEPHS